MLHYGGSDRAIDGGGKCNDGRQSKNGVIPATSRWPRVHVKNNAAYSSSSANLFVMRPATRDSTPPSVRKQLLFIVVINYNNFRTDIHISFGIVLLNHIAFSYIADAFVLRFSLVRTGHGMIGKRKDERVFN